MCHCVTDATVYFLMTQCKIDKKDANDDINATFNQ